MEVRQALGLLRLHFHDSVPLVARAATRYRFRKALLLYKTV